VGLLAGSLEELACLPLGGSQPFVGHGVSKVYFMKSKT
jgi:hypothetical protein